MKTGLYEEIVSLVLSQKLEEGNHFPIFEPLEIVDSHDFLAQYLYRVLAQGLSQVKPKEGIDKDKDRQQSRLNQQISICNEIIQVFQTRNIEEIEDFKVSEQAQRLIAVLEKSTDKKSPPRPDTPLALGALLTGTYRDPSLISQVKRNRFSKPNRHACFIH